MTIGIQDIAYYLPQRTISSKVLSETFDFPLSFIEDKIGVKKIYIAAPDEKTSDLAAKAANKIFEIYPNVRDTIDVLAVCTQTPDHQIPHVSAVLHEKLRLKRSVACFDVGLGCSGFVYGLSIVTSFMDANMMDCGLFVTADTYSRIVQENDKTTKPLFSDAAAATLITRKPCWLPGRFTFGTDGSKYDHLILRKHDSYPCDSDKHLQMNGRGIFEFSIIEIPKDVRRCLAINGIGIDEIDYFVFHQASAFVLDRISRRLQGVDKTRFFKTIGSFGNTVSSSIPIGLKTLLNRNEKFVRKILISGFGVGLSWAATILTTHQEERNE